MEQVQAVFDPRSSGFDPRKSTLEQRKSTLLRESSRDPTPVPAPKLDIPGSPKVDSPSKLPLETPKFSYAGPSWGGNTPRALPQAPPTPVDPTSQRPFTAPTVMNDITVTSLANDRLFGCNFLNEHPVLLECAPAPTRALSRPGFNLAIETHHFRREHQAVHARLVKYPAAGTARYLDSKLCSRACRHSWC